MFKDTTHMAVIDKEGNIFDVTPSGGWINGAVILGDTGIGMSVRGEQFWLDKTRANQIRPRARPRYTLTPSLVFKGDMPMMGIGTPGATTRIRPSCRLSSASSNSGTTGIRTCTGRSSGRGCRRGTSTARSGRTAPGFNKLGVESTVPDAVFKELQNRGHE